MPERVVVTGLGLLTRLGDDPDRSAEQLAAGARPAADWDGTVPIDLRAQLPGRGWRFHRRAALLGCVAARRTLTDAGFDPEDNASGDGLAVALAYNTDPFAAPLYPPLAHRDLLLAEPSFFMNLSINAPASHIAIHTGARAFVATVATGLTGGLDALDLARDALRSGRAERILAGGAEELTEGLVRGLALRPGRPEPPRAAPPAEGAGLLMLETESAARRRGARIDAVLSGSGSGVVLPGEPPERGVHRALSAAFAEAGREPVEVAAVYLSANGDPDLDQTETNALRAMFGSSAPPTVAVKRFWGETGHAGGTLATAAAIVSGRRKGLPPAADGNPQAWRPGPVLIVAQAWNHRAAALLLDLPDA